MKRLIFITWFLWSLLSASAHTPRQGFSAETNTLSRRTAYGNVNGPATVNLLLDGQAVPVRVSGTQSLIWQATLEVGPGTHQLRAQAGRPFYTATSTNRFTNHVAAGQALNTYEGGGGITRRVWQNGGTTNRTQTLLWDANGHLAKVAVSENGLLTRKRRGPTSMAATAG